MTTTTQRGPPRGGVVGRKKERNKGGEERADGTAIDKACRKLSELVLPEKRPRNSPFSVIRHREGETTGNTKGKEDRYMAL